MWFHVNMSQLPLWTQIFEKAICFLQIFLPALSIGPLVPCTPPTPPSEYFVSAKNLACVDLKAFADENDKKALPKRS